MSADHEPAGAEPAPSEPSAPPLQRPSVFQQLMDHKVIQWGVAYVGASLAFAQGLDVAASAFEWPNAVTRTVLVALVVGFPIALTVAWYHGHRALRRVSVGEMSILSALLLVGALLFTVTVRRDDAADALVPSAAAIAAPAAPAAASAVPPAAGDALVLPNKVAVLPCANLSPNPADAYFASGLHQDIIWQLDKVRNLTPIPRLAVLRYASTDRAIDEIAAELMVRALLDCTVRYADNRIRITAELIDAAGLRTLWQANYEPSLADIGDVFAVQADIAMNIANALSVVFTPRDHELLQKPPTVSTDAYVLYLQAHEQADFDSAVALFERAVAADANFAGPQAALAFLKATQLTNTNYSAAVSAEDRTRRGAEVRAYAERAIELDPTIPYARSALTLMEMLNWNWSDAYSRIVRARELTPNDVTQYDIFLLSFLGRYDEALRVVERGEQLYPNDPDNRMWRGWALGYAGKHADAAAGFTAVLEEAPGVQGLLARDWLTRMEIARGNREAALDHLRLSEEIAADQRGPLFLPQWAYAYGRLGETADAQRIFAEMLQREAAGTRFGAGGWAMASLAVGDRERALEWLSEAADKVARHEIDEGFFNLMALRANVTNDETLRQREFAAALQRINGT